MSRFIRHSALLLSCLLTAAPHLAVCQTQPLDAADPAAFATPTREFQPETWFHFIGGNVSPQGITADLEAISGAGIQGVQLFHGQFGGPWPGVEPQIKCLSESWDGAVRHTAEECKRLGLKFTMQNCPGWAMAGGPWITPDKAMRHLVWSRTDLTGGEVSVALPKPQPSGEDWRDYRDVSVLAFPTPEGDTGKALVPVSMKSNRQDLPWEKCLNGQGGGTISLPGGEPTWVEVTLPEEVTLRTVEFPCIQAYNHGWCYDPGVNVAVEAVLADQPREIARCEMPRSNWQGTQPISLACSEVPARTYRITIRNRHPMTFPYIRLYTAARKDNWEGEAAFELRGLIRNPAPRQTKSAWIDPATIVDLTDKMDAGGTLRWTVPAGKWTVMRWGHVNTGRRNGPAPPEGTGWECDKLSPVGAETHFAEYIGRLASPGGPLAGGLLKGMLMDSWECETQTWTPGLGEQFSSLRGYPLEKWFPALAGYVVGDPETTGRFLRDWRATINDLIVKNFFGRMAELGHEKGLSVTYETAMGDVVPGDILEFYKHADVPMCEFWQPRMENYVGSFDFKPVKPCVSAARMYGKQRVAAEAFTSFNLTWNEHPGMLKDIANMHLAEGVTHLVFHTYTHNPRTDFLPPGTSFGSGIGTPFLRGQTWWKHMPEFTNYLARCGEMLEKGRPVSDVLWYLGDELDHKPFQNAPFPAGHHYDYCNPDVLLHRLSVKDGQWVTPEGLSYRLLWLPDCPRMLPETLERMLDLVKQGGIVVGNRPQGIATLSGGSDAEARFKNAVNALWGANATIGKGRVISGVSLEAALKGLRMAPDLEGEEVLWNHRRTDDADWYFVAPSTPNGFKGTLKFRAVGEVELWNPATGEVKPAGVVRSDGQTSLVTLELAPSESVFVVFHSNGGKRANHIVKVERDSVLVTEAVGMNPEVTRPKMVTACYGDPGDPARRADVSSLVRRDLENGLKVIRGGNDWAGGDPAPHTVKRLMVDLRMPNGAVKHLEAREGEPLMLVESPTPGAPVCEVVGGNQLLAWEPGVYRVTRENGGVSTQEALGPVGLLLEKSWKLDFPDGWGALGTMPVERLVSWTELDIPKEAKSFSGTATYTTEFTLNSPPPGARVELDLGRVEVIAGVTVNGKTLGRLWAPPYRLDITGAVKPGTNHLAVEITNTWHNRLSYDAGLDEKLRRTWTINGPGKGAALVPAGLLGPVKVRVGQLLPDR